MPQNTELYTILGVSCSASSSDIKNAYRKLALKHHPDKGGSPDEFKKISHAFSVLGDPEKRKKYDAGQLDNNGQEQQNPFGGGGFDPFDIFSSFFGSGHPFGGTRQSQKPRRKVNIKVSLEDVYNGKESTFRITRQGLCAGCNGQGGNGPHVICSGCSGAGRVRRVVQFGHGIVQQSITQCSDCNGTGKRVSVVCELCNGNKRCEEISNVTINIERGTSDNDSILLENLGDWNTNINNYEDIVLCVETKKHDRVTRKGHDIVLNQTISLVDAICGCMFNYRHLDGSNYTIVANTVIDPEKTYIARSMGMPYKKAKSFGNLVITFTIVYPSSTVNPSSTIESALGKRFIPHTTYKKVIVSAA